MATVFLSISEQLRAKPPVPPLPSFVTEEQYEGSGFKHDVFIEIIDKALDSPGWPADDHAVAQRIIRSNSDVTQIESGSESCPGSSENDGSSSI